MEEGGQMKDKKLAEICKKEGWGLTIWTVKEDK